MTRTDSVAGPAVLDHRPPVPGAAPRVVPGDPRYDDLAVKSANSRMVAGPDEFHLVRTTEQVVHAVTEAVRSGRRLTVRSGGHCYEDFVTDPSVRTVIEMSEMNAVSFDEGRSAFMVEAGAPLIDVYRRLYFGWGVTIPGGSCGSVAAGGHIVGGGYGPHSRQLGLTVDYLAAVEVVVVDTVGGPARAVIATSDPRDPNHELWWAHTGGGGGNFGIVTRYWLRDPRVVGDDPGTLLPRPPARMLSSQSVWSWADIDRTSMQRIVRNHGRWHEQNSAPTSSYNGVFGGLILFGREDDDASPACISFAQIDGTGPQQYRRLSEYMDAVADQMPDPAYAQPLTESPWLARTLELAAMQDARETRLKLKNTVLRRRYPDEQAGLLFDGLDRPDPDRGSVSVSFQSFGGVINAVGAPDTAMVHRDSILQVLYFSTWDAPARDDDRIEWLRRYYRDVHAGAGGVPAPGDLYDGCFINFPDSDLADPAWNSSGVAWHDLYYGTNYARLRDVKTAWDPGDVFRHTLSIRTSLTDPKGTAS
jgi:FAD/FMN-containing dehydrogenase